MNKVYIQPIPVSNDAEMAQEGDERSANVKIRVKNTENLDEFQGTAYLNPQYLDKVQRWIRKNKFSCVGLNNDMEMELKVEIFKFHLAKQPKSEIDTLKQDIASMRKDNNRLQGQLKLFRYYFLQVWREKNRHAIDSRPEFRQELVNSTQGLFDEVQAQGLHLEDFGAKCYYLAFMPGKVEMIHGAAAQPAAFSASTNGTPGAPQIILSQTPGSGTPSGGTPMGSTQMINTMAAGQQQPSISTDAISNLIGWYQESQDEGKQTELEVFISGGGFSYKRASLDVSKMQETGDGTIMVRVNVPIDETSVYTVYIPKKLN